MVARKRTTATKKRRTRVTKSRNDWSEYGLTMSPQEIRDRLLIRTDQLDREIEEQPQFYGLVAEAAAMAKSHVEGLEEEIKTCEAARDREIREDAEREDERITENAIKSLVASDPDRKALVAKQLKAKDAQRRLEAMASSAKSRSYALRDVVDLLLANVYGDSSAKGSAHKRKDYESDRISTKMGERTSGRVSKRRGKLPRSRSKS